MKRALREAMTLGLAALGAIGSSLTVQARPIVPAERRYLPFTGQVAACDNPAVLSAISERFQIRESTYWKSGLRLLGVDHIRDRGYRTTGYDFIPRRYCQGRAAFNDDKFRRIVYWIGESQGFAGYGFGVEWCVKGLDRNDAFAPACVAAGP